MKLSIPVSNRSITLIFCLLSMVCFLYITKTRLLGATPDSVFYIGGARSLYQGLGYSKITPDNQILKITRFAPGYPIALFITNKITGVDSLISAKYLACLCFFLNILIANILFLKFQKNTLAQVFFNLFLISSYAFFEIHLKMWSEPLSFIFINSGIVLFLNYLEDKKNYLLAISSILFFIAFLVRYAEISFWLASVFFLFVTEKNNKQRFIKLLYFSLPFAACETINMLVFNNVDQRSFVFHLIDLNTIIVFLKNLGIWFDPSKNIYLKLLVFIPMHYLFFKKRSFLLPLLHNKLLRYIFFLIVSYIIFLLLIANFFDVKSQLEFNQRILSPIYILVLISYFILVLNSYPTSDGILYKMGIASIAISLLSYTFYFMHQIADFRENGWSYTADKWVKSPMIEEIKGHYLHYKLFSNAPGELSLLLNKNIGNYTLSPNPNIVSDSEKNLMKQSVIVYFYEINNPKVYSKYYPSLPEINKYMSDRQHLMFKDGIIFY